MEGDCGRIYQKFISTIKCKKHQKCGIKKRKIKKIVCRNYEELKLREYENKRRLIKFNNEKMGKKCHNWSGQTKGNDV